MRGSPLFRTVVVALALALAGGALARLTRPIPAPTPAPRVADEPAERHLLEGSYRLTPSASPSTLHIESAGIVHTDPEGRIAIDSRNPVVFLSVRWTGAADGHRFAKLTLDLPGKPTLTHVFEAPGDIDDVWEIDIE